MTRASDIEKPQKFIEIQLRRLMLVFVIFQIFSDSDRCRTCIGECVGQVHGRGAASGNKNAWPVGSVGSRVGVSDPDKAIDTLLKFVEETIPTKASFIKESEEAEKQAQPFDGVNKDLLVNMIKAIAETQYFEGKSKEQIISLLINMEPFARFPELVQSTLE